MNELKQIRTNQCICIKTGKEITCEECVQTLDRNYNEKSCNHIPIAIDHQFRRFKREQKTLKHVLKCTTKGCNNVIKMFREKEEVKCFSCNTWYYKNKQSGEWEKDDYAAKKDQLTFGDIVVKIRKKG